MPATNHKTILLASSFTILLNLSAFADNERFASLEPGLPVSVEPGSGTSEPPTARPSPKRRGKLPEAAFRAGSRDMLPQTTSVRTSCFPGSLRGVLADIAGHFGRPVVVTSGYRPGGRRGSYHRRCMAADIQIAGVAPGAIARYARSHWNVGGVGTYGHTRSVHVDVGDRVYTWRGGSRRRTASLGAGCCPVCAAMEAERRGRRFEAVCAG